MNNQLLNSYQEQINSVANAILRIATPEQIENMTIQNMDEFMQQWYKNELVMNKEIKEQNQQMNLANIKNLL